MMASLAVGSIVQVCAGLSEENEEDTEKQETSDLPSTWIQRMACVTSRPTGHPPPGMPDYDDLCEDSFSCDYTYDELTDGLSTCSGSVNDILDELNREDEMRDSRCLDDADENEESGDNEQNSDHSFNDKMQDQTSKKRKTLN